MDLQEIFESILFSIGTFSITVGQLLRIIVLFLCLSLAHYIISRKFLPRLFVSTEDKPRKTRWVKRIIFYLFSLVAIMGLVMILKVDQIIYNNPNVTIRISTIFQAMLILQLARLLDWIISKGFIHKYYLKRDDKSLPVHQRDKAESEDTANRTVQWSVYIFAIILILRAFQIDYSLGSYQDAESQIIIPFRLSHIFVSILILLVARLIAWLITQLVLYGYYRRKEINVGTQFAINQLLKYVIYVIAIIIAVENLGFQMTVIWGGLAALLVGIGLGLQQTFNDFFSGLILLFERSVEVGDVLEIEGLVGTVKRIGMRASLVESRANLSVIVPNSKLVTQNVINWSHFDNKVRFYIKIGVAYGSDAEKVKEVLIETAQKNPYLIEYPPPFVRFVDFGDSSLNFELHFWSRNFIIIEDVKSDLRFAINKAFVDNHIHIPFPQRDVWLRKSDPSI
jgi:small-conductance mechanosensitive channel